MRLISSQSIVIAYIIMLHLQVFFLYHDVWQEYSKDYFNLLGRIYRHSFKKSHFYPYPWRLEWLELLFEPVCDLRTIVVQWVLNHDFNISLFVYTTVRRIKISSEYVLNWCCRYYCCNITLEAWKVEKVFIVSWIQ